jgi:hypothetical protein
MRRQRRPHVGAPDQGQGDGGPKERPARAVSSTTSCTTRTPPVTSRSCRSRSLPEESRHFRDHAICLRPTVLIRLDSRIPNPRILKVDDVESGRAEETCRYHRNENRPTI